MTRLIINSEYCSVNYHNEHLVLTRLQQGERIEVRAPLRDLDAAVIVGRPYVTMPVLHSLMRRGIPAYFLSTKGRWVGALTPDNNLNAARRLLQYQRASEDSFRLLNARAAAAAKIRNSRRVIQRLAANRGEANSEAVQTVCSQLERSMEAVMEAMTPSALRGVEGLAAARYFDALSACFPPEMPFHERSRRPPRNAANALLSWTYAIVLSELDACARSHGLDVGFGFLHEMAHGRPALSLDLLEPFRAPVADLLVLHLLNHRVLGPDNFEVHPDDGGTYLAESGRKKFFLSYEQAMTRQFKCKKEEAHTDFRRLMDQNVCAYLIALQNGTAYEPFFMP